MDSISCSCIVWWLHRKVRTRIRAPTGWVLPTPAIVPSTHPFVSVVGPLQVWSHHGHRRHKRVGGRREHRRGRCLSGPVFTCTFFLCIVINPGNEHQLILWMDLAIFIRSYLNIYTINNELFLTFDLYLSCPARGSCPEGARGGEDERGEAEATGRNQG